MLNQENVLDADMVKKMNEFENLIRLGRNMKAFGGSKRGALIQLEGQDAWLTNTKRSVIYHIMFKEELGTGTFYAGEAPVMSTRVQRRDDQVLFEFKSKGNIKRILVPNKQPFLEQAKAAFENYYGLPEIEVPVSIFENMDSGMLITRISVDGNELQVKQERSDGSVSFENILKIGKGFMKQNYEPTAEIAFFTTDLYILSDLVTDLVIQLEKGKPISLFGLFVGNGHIKGLISFLEYEE